MRAAAIIGPGCSEKELRAFQSDTTIAWEIGLPSPSAKVDVIVVFGGDGTIHRILPDLLQQETPFLIVPLGSGNDFARSLGIRTVRDARAAWRRFLSGGKNVRGVDLGVIRETSSSTQHYFCTVAGVGLDGEVARRANQLPRWLRGNGGYVLTLLPLLFRFAAFKLKITSNSNEESSWPSSLIAAFANVPTFGGGMQIAPGARFDDGRLDVCVIRDLPRVKLLGVLPTIYFGKHLELKEVEYFQRETALVETETPMDIYADGEFVCRTPVEVRLIPRALKAVTLDRTPA